MLCAVPKDIAVYPQWKQVMVTGITLPNAHGKPELLICDIFDNAVEAHTSQRRVHDPTMIKCGDYYYIFSTNGGIRVRRSKDLIKWQLLGSVYENNVPAWSDLTGRQGTWAPDLQFANGKYYLFYCISTFGSRKSRIGLATNVTLDPKDPNYKWEEHGPILSSETSDNFNAIDPSAIWLDDGRAMLAFGSFSTGIKLVEIDPVTAKPLPNAKYISLARNPRGDAIEGPSLWKHGDYYYLFVSCDFCCRDIDSTYNVRVGRSKSIDGPYVDKDGVNMMNGGGTIMLATKGYEIGPGGGRMMKDETGEYFVYHYYDARTKGESHGHIRPVIWSDEGWPIFGEPIAR